MKFLAIGVYYSSDGSPEYVATDPASVHSFSVERNQNQVAAKIINGFYSQNQIYKISVSGIFHYFQKDEDYIYLLTSHENIDAELLKENKFLLNHFSDIKYVASLTKQYDAFARKITDPTYMISKTMKVRQQIEETKDIMVSNMEKILERGEHIEALVEKTQTLSENAMSFRSAAFSLRREQGPASEKIKRAFCCFFPCLEQEKSTQDERTPLLSPNRHSMIN